MKHAVLTAALLLSGCCGVTDFTDDPLYFDEAWSGDELAVMAGVTSEWAQALDMPMPEISYNEPHGFELDDWFDVRRSVVHRLTEDEARPLRETAELLDDLPAKIYGPNFVGLASVAGSIAIAIERLDSLEELQRVYRHEMGHRLGSWGHVAPPSLMVGTLGRDLDCIDPATLKRVCGCQDCGDGARGTCPE